MSNVDRLHKAGLLNPDVLSDEQKHFINKELTDEEVDDLIKVSDKFADHCKRHNKSFDGMTFTTMTRPPGYPGP